MEFNGPSFEVQALFNPLVLREIFKHSGGNGKTLRLVCKTWNHELLSMPRPKLELIGDRAISHYFSIPGHSTPPESRLGRSLKIEVCEHLQFHPRFPNPQHMEALVTRFGDCIVELYLKVPLPDLLPSVERILRMGLPHLVVLKLESSKCETEKSLKMYDRRRQPDRLWFLVDVDSDSTDEDEAEEDNENDPPGNMGRKRKVSTPPPPIVPLRPNLRILEINSLTVQRRLLQPLLNSAPSLRSLKFWGKGNVRHGLPDLKQQLALRSLSFTEDNDMEKSSPHSCKHFASRVEAVANMLQDVSGRLEHLYLDAVGSPVSANIRKKCLSVFQIPVMRELFTFSNQRPDLFNCGDKLNAINVHKFPKLRRLKLVGIEFSPAFTHRKRLPSCDKSKVCIGENIQLTALSSIKHHGSPFGLSNWNEDFPCLESLDLSLVIPYGSRCNHLKGGLKQQVQERELDAVFTAASYLPKLKHLMVKIPFSIRMTTLIPCLAINCLALRGLDTIQICFASTLEDESEGTTPGNFAEKFLHPLKALEGMQRVQFMGLKIPNSSSNTLTVEKLTKFVADHNLPIQFLPDAESRD